MIWNFRTFHKESNAFISSIGCKVITDFILFSRFPLFGFRRAETRIEKTGGIIKNICSVFNPKTFSISQKMFQPHEKYQQEGTKQPNSCQNNKYRMFPASFEGQCRDALLQGLLHNSPTLQQTQVSSAHSITLCL